MPLRSEWKSFIKPRTEPQQQFLLAGGWLRNCKVARVGKEREKEKADYRKEKDFFKDKKKKKKSDNTEYLAPTTTPPVWNGIKEKSCSYKINK